MEPIKPLESQIKSRFTSHNRYELKLNKNSYEYKYYEKTIESMLSNKSISLVERVKNTLKFRYNHCYTNDLGLKQRCDVQCDFCKNLQEQKEVFNKNQSEKELKKIELKKTQKPSKIKQILTILFK